jgi:6-pyruvoyltetrahydropterin/6-carboxytetrahydropterin synthase
MFLSDGEFMPRVYLKRRARFSASHRLHAEALSAEENIKIFGKCNNPNGHGHNYEILVTIAAEINSDTGMVLNIEDLKSIMQVGIISKVDHKHLNLDVGFLRGINPTAENLVVAFWRQLVPLLPPSSLYEVTLVETENNSVSYFGE